MLELRYHLKRSYCALIALVAKAAAATLLGLLQVVGGDESEDYGGVILYIQP